MKIKSRLQRRYYAL